MTVPSVELSGSGQKMPLVGFGLWKVPRDICADVVYNAIKTGYRLFDGAADYGNEKEAGQGIKKAIEEGLVKREDLFITSKVWNTNHKRENLLMSIDYQLNLWGLDYLDLYLVHFPIALKHVPHETRFPPEWFYDGKSQIEVEDASIQETWQAMEEVHAAGKAKNIGISNFNGQLILDLWRYAKVKPSVLQVEIHPYLTQLPLINLAKKLNIAVTSYSTFGPASWYELGAAKDMGTLMENATVLSVAKSVNKTPAQVILRWALSYGLAVIPKTSNQQRLEENLKVYDFELSKEQIESISALNRNVRFNDPSGFDLRLSIFA